MKTKIGSLILLALCISFPEKIFSAQPTGISTTRRGGQTFLTWNEDTGQSIESYRIYRSTSPISSIGGLTPVGEVKEGSSRIRYTHDNLLDSNSWKLLEASYFYGFYMNIPRAVIQDCPLPTTEFNTAMTSTGGVSHVDFPNMLSATKGLFVWTSKESSATNIYYAVTTVSSTGTEETTITSGQNSLSSPVSETKGKIEPVYYYTDDKTTYDERDCYLMWMDYEQYKNCYLGYVFPVVLTRKYFSTGGKLPEMYLDGYGTTDPGAGYSAYGFGDLNEQGRITWYAGFHNTLAYQGLSEPDTGGLPDGLVQTQKGRDMKDTIYNFMQHRLIEGAMFARRKYSVTDPRFTAGGYSMGGSGCYALLISYPNFVTGVRASHGLSQYVVPGWANGEIAWGDNSTWVNYGTPFVNGDGALANPSYFIPHDADSDYSTRANRFATLYNGKTSTHDIYDVKDAARVMLENTQQSFGLLSAGHGGRDPVVPYCNNGYHLERYLRDSRHCFAYDVNALATHGSLGDLIFHRFVDNMRWDDSRPGFSKVPKRPAYVYDKYNTGGPNGYAYCMDIIWGNKDNSESAITGSRQIVDTATDWEIPVFGYLQDLPASTPFGNYTVDITPRNLQNLSISPGDEFTYQVTDIGGGTIESSGTVYADQWGLATIPGVIIRREGSWAKLHKTGGSTAMDSFLVSIGSGVNEIETPLHYDGAKTISLEVLSCESDRAIASISWTKISGPVCVIASPSSAKTDVSFTTVGTYVFQAACVADNAETGDDQITVTVTTPTTVTRFVNTNSTAGGTGLSNATSGTDRAYASLNECMTAEVADLPMREEIMVIKCCGTNADTTAVDITVGGSDLLKWITDEDYYLVITGNPDVASGRHSGIWDSSKYRLESSGNVLTVPKPGIIIDGLQIRSTGTTGNGIYNENTAYGFYGTIIRNNIIRGGKVGIYSGTSSVPKGPMIYNNIIYDSYEYGIIVKSFYAKVFNNTIWNCNTSNNGDRRSLGIDSHAGAAMIKNNLVINGLRDDMNSETASNMHVGSVSYSKNMTSDSSGQLTSRTWSAGTP